jgi:hypothetical protein
MIWGLSLHGWEDLMRGSLLIVGVSGLIAGLSTWFVVKLQRAEIAQSALELTQYKSDAAVKVEEARNEGVKAGEKAGNALLRAEELRAANLLLEAQIAPRRLEPSQQQKIANALVGFAGRNVAVVSYSLDVEGAVLCQQLMEVLQAAKLPFSNKIGTISPLGSFALGVHVSGPDEELADALRKALGNFTGLFIVPKEQSQSPTAQTGMSAGNASDVPVAASILVGIKPLTR